MRSTSVLQCGLDRPIGAVRSSARLTMVQRQTPIEERVIGHVPVVAQTPMAGARAFRLVRCMHHRFPELLRRWAGLSQHEAQQTLEHRRLAQVRAVPRAVFEAVRDEYPGGGRSERRGQVDERLHPDVELRFRHVKPNGGSAPREEAERVPSRASLGDARIQRHADRRLLDPGDQHVRLRYRRESPRQLRRGSRRTAGRVPLSAARAADPARPA